MHTETNKNGNKTHQNIQESAKAIPREKFMLTNSYFKKKKYLI